MNVIYIAALGKMFLLRLQKVSKILLFSTKMNNEN